MKRLNLLALALIATLPLIFTSCSNDDDLPEVDLSVSFRGATEQNGTLYLVEGDTLVIEGLNVSPVSGSKKATLGATAYYWDYQFLGTTMVEPFGLRINTEELPAGDYLLQINTTVFQVGKSVGIAYITFPVKIVPAQQLPEGVSRDQGGTITPDTDIRSGAQPSI